MFGSIGSIARISPKVIAAVTKNLGTAGGAASGVGAALAKVLPPIAHAVSNGTMQVADGVAAVGSLTGQSAAAVKSATESVVRVALVHALQTALEQAERPVANVANIISSLIQNLQRMQRQSQRASQLSQQELQALLQKQQQMMQTLSAIMAKHNQTANGIINNIR